MKIFIDGDIIKYRAAFAAQRTEYVVKYYDPEYKEDGEVMAENLKAANALATTMRDKGMTVIIDSQVNLEPVGNALHNVRSMIEGIVDSLNGNMDDVVVHLSGDTNFRDDVATFKKYKGNRDKARRPEHGVACVAYMKKNYNYVLSENEEADDTMGIAQWELYDPAVEFCDNSVIVTIDKDLDMIPGMHYNFVKEKSYFVDEATAMRYFWTQMITGDSTDNIQGIKGAGPAKAKTVLNGLHTDDEMRNAVRSLYEEVYKDEGDKAFNEMGQLLWIRRVKGEVWE